MKYSIRRALPSERPQVESLLSELLQGRHGGRYDWMHLGNPHGHSIVWFAVDDASGEIAGCATYFPRTILAEGKVVRAALGGDCWVRPAFRRRGIAKALHARGREEMKDLGIEVMFGTPTKSNETPLLGIGAQNIGHVARYARPLEVERIPLSRFVLARSLTRSSLESLEPLDRRVDTVWERMAPEVSIGTVRDSSFYEWRYRRAPSRTQVAYVACVRGKPIGACALEVISGSLQIVDLVAPRAQWSAVIGAVVRHAASYHPECRSVTIRLCSAEARERQPWRYGMIQREQVVFNVLLPPGDPRSALFFDAKRWYVTTTDTDVDQS